MIPAFHDEQWTEFKRICQDAGILPGGDTDWLWAAHAWSQLDPEQRSAAIADVQERSLEDFTISRSLPQNYVKGRWWTRPHTRRKRVGSDPAAVERHNAWMEKENAKVASAMEEAAAREEALQAAFEVWWQSRSLQEQRALFLREKKALLERCPSLKWSLESQVAELVHACIREQAAKDGVLEVVR